MSTGRVILVYPTVVPERPGSDAWTLLPLSVLSIATPVVEAGFEVEIVDQRTDASWRDTLTRSLEGETPVCVGISAMSGLQVAGALETAKLVRDLVPGVPIVWGGVHASLLPEQTAESELVDYVVAGEGEVAFARLVQTLADGDDPLGQPGVYAARDGRGAGTPPEPPLDVDTLGRPAYDLVKIEQYLNAPFMTTQRPLAFITSRGCPGRCRYCYNLAFNEGRWRGMSSEHVLDEIQHLIDVYGMDAIFLLDDNFFSNWPRVARVCETLIAKDSGVAFLNANCRASTLDSRTPAELELLREAGFQKLFIGVESGSDEILGRIEKGLDVEQVKRVNTALRSAGIVPVYSFMLGFPGETAEQMQATLGLMLDLVDEHPEAVVNAVNIFSPFPGTPLYDDAVRLGMPEPDSLEAWVDLDYVRVNYSAGFSAEEVAFMSTASYMSGLIDPKPLAEATGLGATARRAYAALTRWRVRNGRYGFMPEAGRLARRRLAGGDTAST